MSRNPFPGFTLTPRELRYASLKTSLMRAERESIERRRKIAAIVLKHISNEQGDEPDEIRAKARAMIEAP